MMDDRQKLALKALALMVKQYLEERPDSLVDNHAMSAGKCAFEALAAFGYMEMSEFGARFARCDAGRALLLWDDLASSAAETFPSPPRFS